MILELGPRAFEGNSKDNYNCASHIFKDFKDITPNSFA